MKKVYQLELNGRNVATCDCDYDGKNHYNVNFTSVEDVLEFVGVLLLVIQDLPNGKQVLDAMPVSERLKIDKTLQ